MIPKTTIYPVCKPSFAETEIRLVKEVLDSGWVTCGPKVQQLEGMLSDYIGVRHSVLVSNCTSALFLALFVSGIGPADEVIVPSFTFIATANAVRHVGAIPIFCDIDERSFNLDPRKIEKCITNNTRAIIPVHQMGLPADMEKINRIADKYKLKVIEDAACALGSEYNNKKIGNSNNICWFSFHPRKMITTGEGGLITTSDDTIANELRSLRSHGESMDNMRHKAKAALFLSYRDYGYSFRLSDIQAAVGIEQLKKIDDFIKKRIFLARCYEKFLGNYEGILTPLVPDNMRHTFQSYCVMIKDISRRKRDSVIADLRQKGILCNPGIQAIHRQKIYSNKLELPVTERCSDSTIILPMYHELFEPDIETIASPFLISLYRDK